jgi:hypothetical protein
LNIFSGNNFLNEVSFGYPNAAARKGGQLFDKIKRPMGIAGISGGCAP